MGPGAGSARNRRPARLDQSPAAASRGGETPSTSVTTSVATATVRYRGQCSW